MKKKLILLAGPSCVGKGPLVKALVDLHPEVRFVEPVWRHSRKPRLKKNTNLYETHGVDYYFFPKSLIEGLDRKRFIIANLRSEIQALDTLQMEDLLRKNDIVFTEIYHTFIDPLMDWLKSLDDIDIEIRSVFLTPFSDEELSSAARAAGQTMKQIVTETMKRKLERRGEDPPEKIEERAASAYGEMKYAGRFTDIIVNHAGEDDLEEWGRPLGPEASRVLDEFSKVFL